MRSDETKLKETQKWRYLFRQVFCMPVYNTRIGIKNGD